jgi:hypothetical protein
VFPSLYQTHSPLRLTSAGFSWLNQTHPSPRLTSAGFSMTMSNTPIKHTHRFNWLQQVFPWLYETHPSLQRTSADFDGSVCHSYCKTYWSQSRRWVCLIKSWKNLLKSVQAMAVFDIVMEKPADVSRLTDFTRFFHDYVKNTPLQLTSAIFSITISNTPTACLV